MRITSFSTILMFICSISFLTNSHPLPNPTQDNKPAHLARSETYPAITSLFEPRQSSPDGDDNSPADTDPESATSSGDDDNDSASRAEQARMIAYIQALEMKLDRLEIAMEHFARAQANNLDSGGSGASTKQGGSKDGGSGS